MISYRIRIKYALVFLVLSCLSNLALSQNESNLNSNMDSQKRWFTGGNLGFQFGDQTFIDVSPLVGYKITEKLSVGLSGTYKYFKYKNFYSNPQNSTTYDYTSNIFGGSVFGRYFFFQELFGQTEFEYLNYNHDNYDASGVKFKESSSITSLFVGGGYRQYISDNAAFDLIVLWNLNETIDSPYQNPVIRIGFNMGF